MSQEEPGQDSKTDPVVDSTDSAATESTAPEAEGPESSDAVEAVSATEESDTTEPEPTPEVPADDDPDEPAADEPVTEVPAAEEPADEETVDGAETVTDSSADDVTEEPEPEPEPEPAVDETVATESVTEEESAVTEPTTDIPADAAAETETDAGATVPVAIEKADPEDAAASDTAVPDAAAPDDDVPGDENETAASDTAVPDAAAPDDDVPGDENETAKFDTAVPDAAAPDDDVPGDENETAKFDAVPAAAAAAVTAATVGSPADETTTEVIATDLSAPTEVIEAQTEKINTAKPTPPAPPVGEWKAEAAAPQYIPAGGGMPQRRPSGEPVTKRSRKGLWIFLAALVIIIAVVAAVIGLVSAKSEQPQLAADVAAERALEYTTALREGDIIALRSITCGEAQARFAKMSDQEFAEDHRVQEANNELVGVDGVKASKIVDDGNGAVVEVSAFKTGTPNEKLDVALTLSKIDGEWKVCKA